MKKENIPNALTLLRIALIPIFILVLSLGHSVGMHVFAAIIQIIWMDIWLVNGRL